jgi:predicted ribosome quality control (RQC) complex YloA/Tae2 family protein
MTKPSADETRTLLKTVRSADAQGEVVRIIIDLNEIKNRRDADEAMQAVLKSTIDGSFSVADRNYYLIQIDMKRREVDLDARFKAIEDRLSAIERAISPRPLD